MNTEKRNTNEQEQSAICNVTNRSSSQCRRYVAAPEPENIAELVYFAMLEWEALEELAAERETPEI